MVRLVSALLIGFGATIAAAVALAIFAAIWHIWLAGHGLTSWVDLPQTFPIIGESTPLDIAFVLTCLTIGIVSMIIAGRMTR